ncbi:MAG: hypothetical protein ACW986_08540 [Promethearchaeota archaeon]|jgi:hypothetical protein
MEIIENLKKLGERENWKYLFLVIWLLIGITVIQFPSIGDFDLFPIIGIIIFLPFLTFLMFLLIFSFISKKSIIQYETWKIILLLIVSLPILAILSLILIILFAFSIISYFFFVSWFILYGAYRTGIKTDKKLLKYPSARPFLRIVLFFGGIGLSIFLLYLFLIGPTIFDFSSISTEEVPLFLNLVYIIVSAVIIVFAITGIIYLFKRINIAWIGIFSVLVTVYTLFLTLKIYFGLGSGEDSAPSFWSSIGVIVVDILILLYSLSTLLGSQAETLSKKFKRIGPETVLIWLIFSKVAYEFIHTFPYNLLRNISFPFVDIVSLIERDDINLAKNVAVIAFFILILIIIGIYEIRKYVKNQQTILEEVDLEVNDLLKDSEQEDFSEQTNNTEDSRDSYVNSVDSIDD